MVISYFSCPILQPANDQSGGTRPDCQNQLNCKAIGIYQQAGVGPLSLPLKPAKSPGGGVYVERKQEGQEEGLASLPERPQ
jgi:hypothetical protein